MSIPPTPLGVAFVIAMHSPCCLAHYFYAFFRPTDREIFTNILDHESTRFAKRKFAGFEGLEKERNMSLFGRE